MPPRRTLPRRALLAASALLLAGADKPPHEAVAATPISRMETGWWRARHEAKLAEARARRIDLVWLGDSITEDWEQAGPEDWRNFAPVWQHYYGSRNALNLGFKGDTTSHLLWRLQNGELDGLHPKLAILLIGANDMGRVHWNAEQTVAGIAADLDEARRRMPGAKIILLSVLPSIRSKYVDRTTAAINAALAARYGNGAVPGITYADVTHLFVQNGAVDRTQFLDDHLTPPDPPLHPTAGAQARIAEAIEPLVAAVMGPLPHTAG